MLNRIVNKYKLINNVFKTKIVLILFEKLSPSELYLTKEIFKNNPNINITYIYASTIFDNHPIFSSGNYLYYNNQRIDKLPKGKHILIGESNIESKDLLIYENSNTILYETIK